jgi:hypothetical protein
MTKTQVEVTVSEPAEQDNVMLEPNVGYCCCGRRNRCRRADDSGMGGRVNSRVGLLSKFALSRFGIVHREYPRCRKRRAAFFSELHVQGALSGYTSFAYRARRDPSHSKRSAGNRVPSGHLIIHSTPVRKCQEHLVGQPRQAPCPLNATLDGHGL